MFGISGTKASYAQAKDWLKHCALWWPCVVDKIVGRRLRSTREQSGVSTEFAAALIDVPKSTFLQFEAGTKRASAQHLFALAKTFKVPVEHFFRDDEAAS